MTKRPSLNEFVQHLREIPLFAGLAEPDLQDLAQLSRWREYDAGEVVVLEGKAQPGLYFLQYGSAIKAWRCSWKISCATKAAIQRKQSVFCGIGRCRTVQLGGIFLWASIFLTDYQGVLQGTAYLFWTISLVPIAMLLWQILREGLAELDNGSISLSSVSD